LTCLSAWYALHLRLGRYAKALEHRIKDWVEALIEIQNVMDAWLKVCACARLLLPSKRDRSAPACVGRFHV
jgi:hypothetical protein